MSSSADHPDVFVVGASRSGTTWLQRILGLHPAIATPRETHFINDFLAPFDAAWDRQVQAYNRTVSEYASLGNVDPSLTGGLFGGLPSLMTQAEFDALLTSAYEHVRSSAMALKPGATTFLEKTPTNSLHVDLLARIAPGCYFVHIVREPSDVVSSVMKAAQGWGKDWSPDNADKAARDYRKHVSGALRATRFESRYYELRYEDLVRDTAGEVSEVLTFLGLSLSMDDCAALVGEANRRAGAPQPDGSEFVSLKDAAISKVVSAPPRVPNVPATSGLRARGGTLTRYQQWCVDRVTREFKGKYGYPTEPPLPRTIEVAYEARRKTGRLVRGGRVELRKIRQRAAGGD